MCRCVYQNIKPFSQSTFNMILWLKIITVLVIHLLTQRDITVAGNPDAKRLYDDLLSNYNRLIRPVSNNTQTVLVKLGLRLSQLIDLVSSISWPIQSNIFQYVNRNRIENKLNFFRWFHFFFFSFLKQNLKDQILTTNVWLEHVSRW